MRMQQAQSATRASVTSCTRTVGRGPPADAHACVAVDDGVPLHGSQQLASSSAVPSSSAVSCVTSLRVPSSPTKCGPSTSQPRMTAFSLLTLGMVQALLSALCRVATGAHTASVPQHRGGRKGSAERPRANMPPEWR